MERMLIHTQLTEEGKSYRIQKMICKEYYCEYISTNFINVY